MTTNNDKYNADEMEPPTWLNAQFMVEVLQHYKQSQEVRVLNMKLEPATAKGDHYASVMFRASVEYICQSVGSNISLIIKTMPEQEGHKKKFLGDSHIFKTEISMYTEVLPRFESILKAAGDDKTRLCVPCIFYALEPRPVLVFEDLVPKGYAVIRDRPASIEELKAALSKLAKWHAVSYKLLKEQPTYLDQFKYDLTTLPNYLEQDYFKEAMPNFIALLGRVPGLKQFQKYFQQMGSTLVNRWVGILREYRENPQPDTYYVLCHGDCHLRNMMFKNNPETAALEDCMLLDFQICYAGPMTNDLLYSIYMLFSAEDRKQRRDELLYYYFENFTKTLQLIGFKGTAPSLIGFRQQLFDRKYYELFLLSAFLPAIICIRKEGMDPGELHSSADQRLKLYNDEDYIAELQYLLPRLLHLGYFEQYS